MTELNKKQAILLLTARFSHAQNEQVNPLTIGEWKRFADWLRNRGLKPWDLKIGKIREQLSEWSDKSVTLERIERLLQRGTALALAMQKWTSAGLWVLTRSEFPKRFKQRLGESAPIVLYGCGNQALLKDGGLAIIGSRDADDEDLAYSSSIGALAAQSELPVVSGGARGVDKFAMLGALVNNGIVIGVLANDLLRASSSIMYRRYLMEERLVLISSFAPEARFNVGNAMERNKYIYCLSDRALVVYSEKKGGTWTGANENLKREWGVPLLVKRTINKKAGNEDLVKVGGEWAPRNIHDALNTVLIPRGSANTTTTVEIEDHGVVGEGVKPFNDTKINQSIFLEEDSHSDAKFAGSDEEGENTGSNTQVQPDDLGFYQVFISILRELCNEHPKTREQLADKMDLQKSQLDKWLKQAIHDRKIIKIRNPRVHYQWISTEQDSFRFNQASDKPHR